MVICALLRYNKRSLILLCLFILTTGALFSQQFLNIRTEYQNDTLRIKYDLSGKVDLDSVKINIKGDKNSYNLHFFGDIYKPIKPGMDKEIIAFVPRDSFPDNGDNLNIKLIGWTKDNVPKKSHRPRFDFKFFAAPKNPRFSTVIAGGVVFPTQNYSKFGSSLLFKFNYQPSYNTRIGLGAEYLGLNDTLKSSMQFLPLFINTEYDFINTAIQVYGLLRFGYSSEYNIPVLASGLGLKTTIFGPIALNTELVYNAFCGKEEFNAFNANLGLCVNFSSRYRYITERSYRFRKYVINIETGINYINRSALNLSADFSKAISPYYHQGIGISIERVKAKFLYEIESDYFSTYYKQTKKYVAFVYPIETKITMLPVFVCGKIFFSTNKYRPFLLWKYGYTIFSDINKGNLSNGFITDLGFGMLFPLSKYNGLTVSFGAKYFTNKLKYQDFELSKMGTAFLKIGVMF